MTTKEEFEVALDSGKLHVKMAHNKSWLVRRNGQTQVWKRSANFCIPCKCGAKTTFQITESDSLNNFEVRS